MTNKEIIEDVYPELKKLGDDVLYLKIDMMLEMARMDQLKKSHSIATKTIDEVFGKTDKV